MSNPAREKAGKKGRVIQFRNNAQNGTCGRISEVDKGLVIAAIDASIELGAAIMFGKTRDGGAFSVLILDNDQKAKAYAHGKDEMEQLLRDIVEQMT